MFRAVLFDLGNTLVWFWARPEFPEVLREAISGVRDLLAGQGVLRVSPEVMWQRVAEEDHSLPGHRVYPLAERLARIFVISQDQLLSSMCRRFMEPIFSRGTLYADVFPTLERLRARGYRTGIISNTPWGGPAALCRQEIERIGLRERVDVDVFCDDVGWRKPARQIFEYALDRLGLAPEQCLFVGDDPRWDLVGPRALGMQAVLIDRPGTMADVGERPIRSLDELWARLAPAYSLRPATETDYAFLYALHVATLKEYVAQTWGWDEAFQARRFRERFDPANSQIIVVDGQDVGVLAVGSGAGEVLLGNIRIAPDWQRRGLGTAVIQDVLSKAREDGLTVVLQVLKVNPARSLYERLGFVVVGETDTHYQMRTQ